jgi:ribosomal protein S18 acetylase RimI-like enzyme
MNIRRATPDDADAIAKIHVDSWRSAYRDLVPEAYLDKLDYGRRAQYLKNSLTEKSEEAYLWEQDGKVFGFLTLAQCRDADVDQKTTGEICGIYLDPENWRKGIGRELCRYSEGLLGTRGNLSIVLWVFAGNDQARRFYEAMGFETDGASRIINPGTPLEIIRYRKDIKNARST